MNILSTSTAAEVLGGWLKQEYGTRLDIWTQVDAALANLQLAPAVISSPDYADNEQNEARRVILGRTSRAVILGWIDLYGWNRVSLAEGEIDSIRTLQGDDWRRRTGGTFLVGGMIQLLSREQGKNQLRNVGEAVWIEDIERVANAIRVSGDSGPIVAVSEGQVLTLMEGYHRLTAVRVLQLDGMRISASPFYLGKPVSNRS